MRSGYFDLNWVLCFRFCCPLRCHSSFSLILSDFYRMATMSNLYLEVWCRLSLSHIVPPPVNYISSFPARRYFISPFNPSLPTLTIQPFTPVNTLPCFRVCCPFPSESGFHFHIAEAAEPNSKSFRYLSRTLCRCPCSSSCQPLSPPLSLYSSLFSC